MDKHTLWKTMLPIMERVVTRVVFDTMIRTMVAVSYQDDVLTLQAPNDFVRQTVVRRHESDIARVAGEVAGCDVEIIIVTPDGDAADGGNEIPGYARTGLRKKYNFETFVPGKCNQLAYAAACAVADMPGQAEGYNPLFLYGGVGLGKTHLIHAIGNQVLQNRPALKLLYVSSDSFMQEFVTSIRERTTSIFKHKYRTCDILLVDDVQFLDGKVETQEEMFHTFNNLHSAGKQIVLTSDVPPKDLKGLESRLTNRFASGLTCDVSIPDYETRTAILEKKLTSERLNIPQIVKEYITRNIVTNVRDLEGALNKVMACARLTNTEITLELAEATLRDQIAASEKPSLSIEYIKSIVAAHYGVPVNDLSGKRRNREIVVPRQVAMYLCRKLMSASFPEIGNAFGGRDHTTAIHAHEKILGEIEISAGMREVAESLEARLLG